MKITSGDLHGYRIEVQSVTGAAHSAMSNMSKAEREIVVARITRALDAMLNRTELVATPPPSDERRALVTDDTPEHA